MTNISRKEPFLLLLGDLAVLLVSLWITLLLRYLSVPSMEIFSLHLAPFSVVFLCWIIVFFIAGLYERQTFVLGNRFPGILFRAYLGNAFIAVVFFYAFPSYDIAPKTNLFIDLAVSFVLILLWRLALSALTSSGSRENALLIASGSEAAELFAEVNRSRRLPFRFGEVISLEKGEEADIEQKITQRIETGDFSYIVADFSDQRLVSALPIFYRTFFSGVSFVDFGAMYESVFERVPLSLVSHRWFLENISLSRKPIYDIVKRVMDIILAIPVGLLYLVSLPFVWIALKIQDGGSVLISQERVGQRGEMVSMYKYRTMHGSDRGVWLSDNDNRVTSVGKILRTSRIDELAQSWNVIRGDLSFIGPRPDIIGTYEHLVKELPYYRVRTIVKPGLSGWAQIKQEKPPQSLEETRLRLAYDFYYIKNRSFFLDLKIALRTVQTLLSRLGV